MSSGFKSSMWGSARAAQLEDEERGGLRPHLGQESADGMGPGGGGRGFPFGDPGRAGGDGSGDGRRGGAVIGGRYNDYG